jgi:hypothetical protein
MLNEQWQQNIANELSHWAHMAKESIENAASEHMRPSVLFKPRVFIDGNQWCALYGDNLQDGVAGFGDSPADAMWDFDSQWNKKLPAEAPSRADDVLKDHGFPEIRVKEDKTC